MITTKVLRTLVTILLGLFVVALVYPSTEHLFKSYTMTIVTTLITIIIYVLLIRLSWETKSRFVSLLILIFLLVTLIGLAYLQFSITPKNQCEEFSEYVGIEKIDCTRNVLLSVINAHTTEYVDPLTDQLTNWSERQYTVLIKNWPDLDINAFIKVRSEYLNQTQNLFCHP